MGPWTFTKIHHPACCMNLTSHLEFNTRDWCLTCKWYTDWHIVESVAFFPGEDQNTSLACFRRKGKVVFLYIAFCRDRTPGLQYALSCLLRDPLFYALWIGPKRLQLHCRMRPPVVYCTRIFPIGFFILKPHQETNLQYMYSLSPQWKKIQTKNCKFEGISRWKTFRIQRGWLRDSFSCLFFSERKLQWLWALSPIKRHEGNFPFCKQNRLTLTLWFYLPRRGFKIHSRGDL